MVYPTQIGIHDIYILHIYLSVANLFVNRYIYQLLLFQMKEWKYIIYRIDIDFCIWLLIIYRNANKSFDWTFERKIYYVNM